MIYHKRDNFDNDDSIIFVSLYMQIMHIMQIIAPCM